MAYQMVQMPVTLSQAESHFGSYDWQSASCGHSASAERLVFISTWDIFVDSEVYFYDVTRFSFSSVLLWRPCSTYVCQSDKYTISPPKIRRFSAVHANTLTQILHLTVTRLHSFHRAPTEMNTYRRFMIFVIQLPLWLSTKQSTSSTHVLT